MILGAGRLVQQKDFATLIRAFLCSCASDVRLARRILGEGDERQRLEGLATDLGIGQDVSLPGDEQNPYR